ncbi:contractile injection system tape measure protein [Xenorhabdus sp. KK7.4]|uniref:contractile injection system tape measure protein n=1 Tax=Xenorhabdus sp. KK7.4 TaxID=1851572 RepID=UPI0012906DC3|nr:contractile injection system tape measure protein [Xenorhabdus sp. KK7.4]
MEKNHKIKFNNVIDKLSISLEIEKHHSNKILKKCSDLFKLKLRYLIDEEVGQWSSQDNDNTLEKIVLNLGEIAFEDFEQQFIWRLERELKNKTKELKINVKHNVDCDLFISGKINSESKDLSKSKPKVSVSSTLCSEEFTLNNIDNYLNHGYWESSILCQQVKNTEFSYWLIENIRLHPQQWLPMLAKHCLQPAGLNRLIQICQPDVLSLLRKLFSEEIASKFINSQTKITIDKKVTPEKLRLSAEYYLKHQVRYEHAVKKEFILQTENKLTSEREFIETRFNSLKPDNKGVYTRAETILNVKNNLISKRELIESSVDLLSPNNDKFYMPAEMTLNVKNKLASEREIIESSVDLLKPNNDKFHMPAEMELNVKDKLESEREFIERSVDLLKRNNDKVHIPAETILNVKNELTSEREFAENSFNSLKPDNNEIHTQIETKLNVKNNLISERELVENSAHSLKLDNNEIHTQTETTLNVKNNLIPNRELVENSFSSLKPDNNEVHIQTEMALNIKNKLTLEREKVGNTFNSLKPNNNKTHIITESTSQTKIKKTPAVNIIQDECNQLKQTHNETEIQIDAVPSISQLIQTQYQPAATQQYDGLIEKTVKQNASILKNKEQHSELLKPTSLAQISPTQPINGIQTSSAQSVLSISNAGCMILWPLLPTFFRTFDLLEKNQFVSLEAQRKAVCLLDWLIWAEEEIPVWRLTLNKILCGLPMHDNALWLTPEPEQKIAINQWLEKTVVQLPAWKKMGVNDVRHLFLQRSGELNELNGLINIHIKPEVYDVLISEWPWPINIAHFSWLKYPITITWL